MSLGKVGLLDFLQNTLVSFLMPLSNVLSNDKLCSTFGEISFYQLQGIMSVDDIENHSTVFHCSHFLELL